MKTYDDVDNHLLAPLMAARFDNADAAYALDLPNFTDHRKSLERLNFLSLPRIDANPVRPGYKLAHIYEYALHKELSKSTTKEVAGIFLREIFREMRARCSNRMDEYEKQIRIDAAENHSFKGHPDPGGLGALVDYPWAGLDPEVLDRSPERLANPFLWVFAPGVTADDEYPHLRYVRSEGAQPIMQAIDNLKEIYPFGERCRSAVVVNVTDALKTVDDKLWTRLRGRRLKGASHDD